MDDFEWAIDTPTYIHDGLQFRFRTDDGGIVYTLKLDYANEGLVDVTWYNGSVAYKIEDVKDYLLNEVWVTI